MLHVRVTYRGAADLRRAIAEEMRRGVMLAKIEAPPSLEFRDRVSVELATASASLRFDSEVVSILAGVGVGVVFPPEKLSEASALLAGAGAEPDGETSHEIVVVAEPVIPAATARSGSFESPGAASYQRLSFAEKVQLALHGSRDDRVMILRDQNKQLHPFVLKAPTVQPEEVAGWAGNAQMSPDFLKQIAERKEWLSRPAIAQALAKNPKSPSDVAIKALDYVSTEMLRQMAKGVGAPPAIVQAARKKILPK